MLNGQTELIFATVGNNQFRLWKLDTDGSNDLLFLEVPMPEEANLTAVCATPFLNAPYNTSLLLLGTSEGSIIVFNSMTNEFIAKVGEVARGPIGLIHATESAVFVADESGRLVRSEVVPEKDLFNTPGTNLELDSPIVAISFD